jgi:hypothetical protein
VEDQMLLAAMQAMADIKMQVVDQIQLQWMIYHFNS